jgi:hypothetical protein
MTELQGHADDTVAIKTLIQKFFDAINASDPQTLATHFFATANITIIRQEPPRAPDASYHAAYANLPLPPQAKVERSQTGQDEKLQVVIRTTIEKFVALLEEGQKHRKPGQGPILHEAPDLKATDVKIDGLFGTAWSPFRVTFDDVLHHYGIMVYTVGKEDGKWKIEGLTQSYRRTLGWEEKPGSVL